MPLSTINNGASSATARANINAAITGLNNASGPSVIYVTTAGSDTTGDGTLAKPFLTAQKAYDIGKAAAVPFKISFGKGSFSFSESVAAVTSHLKCVEGIGFNLGTPNESLTILYIANNPAVVSNSNGTNGFSNLPLQAENLYLYYGAQGGSVESSDEIGNYTGGTGGTVSIYGHALFGAAATGGNANQNVNGEAGTGGAPGSITIKGGFLSELYCYNGTGFSNGEIPPSIGGAVALDGVNGALCSAPTVYPILTLARSSLPTAFTITNDLGGNAAY
jgi:hypothetical protein